MAEQLFRNRRRWVAPTVSTASSVGSAVLLACTHGAFDCSRFGDPPACVEKACQCPSFPGNPC